VLLVICLGNAEVIHELLVSTGSKDSYLLWAAIVGVELLIATASTFGVTGLATATVLFCVSVYGIHTMFPASWVNHSVFSIAVYCGSVSSYVRHRLASGEQRRLVVERTGVSLDVSEEGDLDQRQFAGKSAGELARALGIPYHRAQKLRKWAESGGTVTTAMLEDMRKPVPSREPAPVPR
jgi:hypothetical protein